MKKFLVLSLLLTTACVHSRDYSNLETFYAAEAGCEKLTLAGNYQTTTAIFRSQGPNQTLDKPYTVKEYVCVKDTAANNQQTVSLDELKAHMAPAENVEKPTKAGFIVPPGQAQLVKQFRYIYRN